MDPLSKPMQSGNIQELCTAWSALLRAPADRMTDTGIHDQVSQNIHCG